MQHFRNDLYLGILAGAGKTHFKICPLEPKRKVAEKHIIGVFEIYKK